MDDVVVDIILTSVVRAGHGTAAHLQNRDSVFVLLDRGLSWIEDQRSHREQGLAKCRLAKRRSVCDNDAVRDIVSVQPIN